MIIFVINTNANVKNEPNITANTPNFLSCLFVLSLQNNLFVSSLNEQTFNGLYIGKYVSA